ncbi:MAG: hypothetical protein NVS3B24_04040 [Candidatus Dormibacteria bacterium]
MRAIRQLIVLVALPLLVLWPRLPFVSFSVLGATDRSLEYLLITVSLVLLTGWVGQISLGHAAFVGIGAYTTALFINRFHVPFPLNLPLAILISGGVAVALGAVALRVRGLYLAVATLIFAWMCDAYLFSASWFVPDVSGTVVPNQVVGSAGGFPFFDLGDRASFYYIALAAGLLSLYVASNLRDSKTGRAFYAIRGSELAAASLGINITRYKLLAFAISGMMAGAAGNLIMVSQKSVVPVEFNFTVSLFAVAILVVGGTGSLSGAVVASVIFGSLSEVFFNFSQLNGLLDLITFGLLLLVLLTAPGGLAEIGERISSRSIGAIPLAPIERLVKRPFQRLSAAIDARGGRITSKVVRGADPLDLQDASGVLERQVVDAQAEAGDRDTLDGELEPPGHAAILRLRPQVAEKAQAMARLRAADPVSRASAAPIIEVAGATVRFGGLTALGGVTLTVREGEIVGLIGPNGAGKTTCFNAIAGLNSPSAGEVSLFGKEVTRWAPHQRAGLGMARTFQVIQMFPQLTVFENLMVATHLHNPTGALSHILVSARSVRAEKAARDRVRRALSLLNLEEFADRHVSAVPFGVLRMVDVARAVVTGARLILLDEPASGLDGGETDRLVDLLLGLRGLGISLLVIEHDVEMVVGLSDYIYVLDQGQLLAEGTPSVVQANPDVITAYLGRPAVAAG